MKHNSINTKQSRNEIFSNVSRVFKIGIPFGFVGLIIGIFLFHNFTEKDLKYVSNGEFESHATNGETVSDVLTSINFMDNRTKAKALKIPLTTASNLIKIIANSKIIMKSPENPVYKSYIQFELTFTNKFEINRIINGLNFYLNHNKYLLKELILYKKKREIKRELLKNIDLEINNIYRLNQENKGIRGFSYKSNADLYKLKLDLNFDLLNPNTIIRIVNVSEPKLKSIISSKYILILLSTFIGFLIGITFFQIKNSIKLNLFNNGKF